MLGISSLGATWKFFLLMSRVSRTSSFSFLLLLLPPPSPGLSGGQRSSLRGIEGGRWLLTLFLLDPISTEPLALRPPFLSHPTFQLMYPLHAVHPPPPLFWYFPSGPFFLLSGLYRKRNKGGHFQYQAQIAKASLPKTEIIKQVCNFANVLITSCSGKNCPKRNV